MRILYAHCFYRIPGGEDRHVRDQVDLVSRTHDVELMSEANVDLLEGTSTAARMLYSRSKKQQAAAVIERFAPHVVHVHNAYPSLGPAVLLAARERGVPVVMTVHNFRLRCPNGLMFTEGAICHRCESGQYLNALTHRCFPTKKQAAAYGTILWAHRFVMRLGERIARFIAPSEFMGRRLVEWGMGAERVRVIRNFVPSACSSASDPRIGSYGAFVGRLAAEKGLDVLLAALRRAGDPPFVIFGDGPRRRPLEDLADGLQLANTTFVGWRPREELGQLVAAARYVALPSISEENAPLAALEALAAGRPLLVSESGGLPELVATGAGVACRNGDEIDISDKITLLMEDDEFCRQASAEALTFAQRFLGPERHLADLESLYRELANGAR